MLHRVVVEYKAGSVETTAKRTIVTDNADGSRSKLTKTVCETLKVCLCSQVFYRFLLTTACLQLPFAPSGIEFKRENGGVVITVKKPRKAPLVVKPTDIEIK